MENKFLNNYLQQTDLNTKEIEKIKQSLGEALPDPIPGPQGEQGEQGEKGEQGPRGKSLFTSGWPLRDPGSYEEGDLLLCIAANDKLGNVYKKVAKHWVLQCNIRGPQGIQGQGGGTEVIANPEEDPDDNLNKIEIDGVVYATPQVNITTISDYVEGSDTVVFDVNEDDDKLQIRLDQDVVDEIDSKLDASKAAVSAVGGLVTPDVAPTATSLVGIDNNNEQKILGIGTGLKISSSGKLMANNVLPTDLTNVLYGTNSIGMQKEYAFSDSSITPGYIPRRDARGELIVPLLPRGSNAATSKQYVDNAVKLSNIKDSDGNLRFQTGEGTIHTASPYFEVLYNKYAISGNHVMFVLDFKCLANAHPASEVFQVEYDIPEWVWNKLVPRTGNYLDGMYVHPSKYGYDVQNQLYFPFYIWKHPSEHKIRILNLALDNDNFDCYGRCVFDFILA